MLLAALIAAWQPSSAQAADEDVQLWQFAVLSGDLDADTHITLDASQRWRANGSGGDQHTLRVMIEQSLAPGVRIGGGAMVLEAGGNTEWRPHQQISFSKGRFDLRTRLEQRFFDGADRVEVRLRQRIQYHHPLGQGWRAHVGGEWFGLLQPRRRGEGAATEQWRAQAGVTYRLNPRLEIGANYWLLVFPEGAGPARTSHVPQTVLSYHF
jgi:hypothetical protein